MSDSSDLNYEMKISELTVGELKILIDLAVKDSIENLVENSEALSSLGFMKSIKEARGEYNKGDFVNLEDIT